MNLSGIKKTTHLRPVAAAVGKTYRTSGFTLKWSGYLFFWLSRATYNRISSGIRILENILKKPLKLPEFPLLSWIYSNPVFPEGLQLTSAHLCSVKTNY
jgi:hypothetical protein